MNDKTLSFTRRSLAEALDNVRCLSDLGPELIAEQVFAASAQQPAQAVPDGWKLVPFHATREQVNAVFMHPDLARTLYRNMVEAAPAAPVAQEPAEDAGLAFSALPCAGFWRWLHRCNRVPPAAEHPIGDSASPVAEQPSGTTSDRYRAELYDEVWERARSMGYGNVTMALAELERLKAAAQPDTVNVRREQLADAVVLFEKVLGWTTSSDYEAAASACSGLRALLGKDGE